MASDSVETSELSAIDKHLSAFDDRLRQGLAVALVLLVAGAGHASEIDLLGLKIPRNLAVFLGSFVILFFQFSMLDKSVRIRALFKAIPDANLPSHCRAIGLHPWSANPFALFGTSRVAFVNSAKGLGLLFFAYVVMNSWIFTFGRRRSAGAVGVVAPFVLILLSLLTWLVIWTTKREMRKRLSSDKELSQTLARQSRYEWAWLAGFLVLGLLFCVWLVVLKGQIV